MDGVQFTDRSRLNHFFGLDESREVVAIPKEKFDIVALHSLDEPVAFREPGGHRLIGNDVQSGVCGADG